MRSAYPFYLFVLLLPFATIPLTHAEERVVTFSVPDGTTFIETMRFERTVTLGNEAPRDTLFESQSRLTIRNTPSGYSIYVEPVRPADMRPSADVAALLGGIMTRLELRYDLDAEGNLVNIAGVEQTLADIESIMPRELRPILELVGFTRDGMTQAAAYDWQVRGLFYFAQLSGRALTLEEEFAVDDVPFPSALGGTFRSTGHLGPVVEIACGARRCLRFYSVGESADPTLGDALARFVNGMIAGTIEAFAPADDRPTPPRLQITQPHELVRLSRVFDPETGLHYSYTQEHEIEALMGFDEPGDVPVPIRITLSRHYTYDYR